MNKIAKIKERIPWHGKIKIIARHKDGTEEVTELENIITDAGKNLLRGFLDGTVTDGAIKYVALGASSTTPAAGDTQLGDERFRKQVTKQETGSAGVLDTTVYIAPYEANDFIIEEIGWFAGANATETANSGVMIARVLYSRAKTELESLQIVRTDTIG